MKVCEIKLTVLLKLYANGEKGILNKKKTMEFEKY